MMHRNEVHDSGAENEEGNVISIPAESLFDVDGFKSMWPETLTNNSAFLDQLETRKRLIDALHVLQSQITDPAASFESHLEKNAISEEQVADLYEALTDLLRSNPEYSRIILYLPFEYLLSTEWKAGTERLALQAEQFKAAYMHTWERLLYSHNVRANFVDGDVLETEKREGDLPRVVKAAHLIPFLVQKGWLSVDDVLEKHEAADHDALQESIADTFGVLYDVGLMEEDVMRLYGISLKKASIEDMPAPKSIDTASLRQEIEQRLANMPMEDGDPTAKRQAWLTEVHRQKVINEVAEEVQLSLHHQLLPDETVRQLLLPESHIPSQLAFIEGVRKEVESLAASDKQAALFTYNQFKEPLHTLWEMENPETQRYLRRLFFRLHHLGIVDAGTLHSLGLSIPHLSGPFSENVKQLGAETRETKRIIDSIRRDPLLKQYVYPVVMMYGSKVKGYGANNADNDLAVFIRPITPDDVSTAVRDQLISVCSFDSPNDSVTEFWLTEEGDGLSVRDFDSHDRALGDSISTHVLFGAAWHGDIHAMRELYAQLLSKYFVKTDAEMFGSNVRDVHLECLEHDLLQYRLMHKGYERYYPSAGGIKTPHADRIDGDSMFWDCGYRAVATKLFVERVFLPKL